MTMTTDIDIIKSKRLEYQKNIKSFEQRLEQLQSECPHTPKQEVSVVNMIGYKMIYTCNRCGKVWKEGEIQ